MNRIYLTLATFAILIIASNALYRHQVGKFDWDVRTIGDIERVRFLGSKTAFITKDGFIGVFLTHNGNTLYFLILNNLRNNRMEQRSFNTKFICPIYTKW